MNKRALFLLPVCLWAAATAFSLPPVPRPLPLRLLHQNAVTRSLSQRVARTSQHTLVNRQLYPLANRLASPVASRRTSALIQANPAELYDAPFLQTHEQLTLYFLAAKNRANMVWLPKIQHQQEEIINHLDALDCPQNRPQVAPGQDIAWLADHIPADTQYLLLGERHGFDEITSGVITLLELLQQKHGRQILLFTEFLPENQIWGVTVHATRLTRFLPAWERTRQLGIPVIGLEPPFVANNLGITSSDFTAPDQPADKAENIWWSFEGLRLRNERWHALLSEYRRQFPEALFVVYSGTTHVTYGWAHSLGDKLSDSNTFVTTLYPDKMPDENGLPSYQTSPFDLISRERFSGVHLLHVGDKPLARLVGFDAQLKIPVTLNR